MINDFKFRIAENGIKFKGHFCKVVSERRTEKICNKVKAFKF